MKFKKHFFDKINSPREYVELRRKKLKRKLLITRFFYYFLNLIIAFLAFLIGTITALRLGNGILYTFAAEDKTLVLIFTSTMASISATLSGFVSFFLVKDLKDKYEKQLELVTVEFVYYESEIGSYEMYNKEIKDYLLLKKIQRILEIGEQIIKIESEENEK